MTNTVTMLKTTMGVDDAQVHAKTYFEGEQYEIGDSLLAAFIEQGAVELIQGQKSEGDAPEDKMIDAAPENKSRKKKG